MLETMRAEKLSLAINRTFVVNLQHIVVYGLDVQGFRVGRKVDLEGLNVQTWEFL